MALLGHSLRIFSASGPTLCLLLLQERPKMVRCGE